MRARQFFASVLAVSSALVMSAPGIASAGIFGFGRSDSSSSRPKSESRTTPDRSSNAWVSVLNAQHKLTGGWSSSSSSGLGPAKPTQGSIPVGGGWRLFVGRNIGNERRGGNGGTEWTKARTFGLGKGATVSPQHGNVVFEKGRAIQTWRSATRWSWGHGSSATLKGTTVTAGTQTRTQLRGGPRPLTAAEKKVLNTPKSPAAAAASWYTNSLGGDG
jgi:hypothetical protein